MKASRIPLALLCAWTLGVPAGAGNTSAARYYLYLSDQRLATVELVDTTKVILNYISLGETLEVLQAPLLAVADASGGHGNGHVFLNEDPSQAAERYFVDDLIRPREYRGYTILGRFPDPDLARQVYLKVGSRILILEPLSDEEFERVAGKVAGIDLERSDSKVSLLLAGFDRAVGRLVFAGSEEGIPLQHLFPSLEVLPPQVLANPAPRIPPSLASKVAWPVVVQVSGLVTRAGGIYQLEVVRGVHPQLDELALETVRNSWKFLPAIARGKVSDATLTLNVVFQGPGA